MANSYRHSSSGSAGGFTLAEMLVAVGMGVMLVVAAAGVFSLATQAVGSSQANTQINNKLRVLFSWLDRDFARIRLDGYLGLIPQDGNLGSGTNVHFDQVYFLISGDIHSMDTDYSASLAVVSYGPDDTVNNAPLVEPYDWIFTRRAMLIVSDDPLATIPIDARLSSFAELLAGSTIWNEATTRPDFDYDQATDTYSFATNPEELPTYLVGNVTSFKIVQYYMAGDSGPIKYDSAEWPAGTDKTFGPAQSKPVWIEFEITLRDSNNQLDEDYVSTYRVNLPSR